MSTEWVIGIVLTILGWVLGVGSSYFFYQRSLRLKQPTWAILSDNLIRQGKDLLLPKLEIRYDGSPLQNLTVSRIWLWNRGREPIRQQDILDGDPLRIEPVGDTRLLGVEVLETSYKASDFSRSLPDDRGVVQIGFASLDQAQGGVLQVVHTGTSSDDILVKWTVVGGNPLKKVDIQSFTVFGSILLNRIRSFVGFLVMLAGSTVIPATLHLVFITL